MRALPKSEPVAGLILAGGQGSRMGYVDKALLPFGGQALLAHVQGRFAPQVARCWLSANGDAARFAGFGLPVLPDLAQGQGPLAGVLAGLYAARAAGFAALATVSVDTPFVPLDLVARLCAAAGAPAQAVCAGRAHPTAALWPVARLAALEALLAEGERRLRLGLGAAVEVEFALPDPFENLNTPEDLARAEARLPR